MHDLIIWQRIEGLGVFLAALALFWNTPADMAWWIALLVFFAPDLSFAGYLFGNVIGAVVYNLVHAYAFGAIVLAAGALLSESWIVAAGVLWLGHSGFDRMLGYGLKATTGFKHTHLGDL